MDWVDQNEVELLSAREDPASASIFMPGHRAGQPVREGPLRLKNLLKSAEAQLRARGLKPSKARELLAPGRRLTQRAGFWQKQENGLAIFLSERLFRYFRVSLPLAELVVVADRFEISPLVPLFFAGGSFYLLGISRNRVRFFAGTATELIERDLPPGVPRSEDDALRFDVRESVLQLHSGSARPGYGKESAVFTGQGIGVDDEQARTREFLLQVERGICRTLRNVRVPLVLAGVQELVSEYHRLNKYPHLLDAAMPGNVDHANVSELFARAWEVLRPQFESERKSALLRYADLSDSGKRSSDLHRILSSAHNGRVESMFLASGAHAWGRFELQNGQSRIEVHAEPRTGDQDLFNLAAIETILTRGAVFAIPRAEMPEHQEVAAIFRY